jgi:hypothetical protein
MNRPIFRKAALKRLASPDQLDQLMQVTNPRGWVALAGFALLLFAALLWGVLGTISTTVEGRGVLLRGGIKPLLSPADGVVEKFLRRAGDEVKKGEPLVALTTASGPRTVHSPFHGRMLNRTAKEGDPVKKNTALLMLESLAEPLLARLYVPVSEGYKVQTGMAVHVWPANVKADEFGYLVGKVVSTGRFPITRQELADRLGNDDLAGDLLAGAAKLQILVSLTEADTPSGFRWSGGRGPDLPLYSGTPCQARIVVARHRPLHLVFPNLVD